MKLKAPSVSVPLRSIPLPLCAAVAAAAALLSGCLNLQLGGGSTTRPQSPTVGQQLIDLKKARDTGAITDAEYQSSRAKLLGHP